MRPYLVCYDYGTGGLWWWITAPSAEAISSRYREVSIFEQPPPPWWNDEVDGRTPRRALGDDPDDALTLLTR